MKQLLVLGLASAVACGLTACSGEDDDGLGMATEVNGQCVFTPGSYVASYRVVDSTPPCGNVTPLPDEYLSVTEGGTFVGTADTTVAGCVESDFITEGCFVAFDRTCVGETADGRFESNIGFQFEYAKGTGIVTFSGERYSGTTLLDRCFINFDVTIRAR